MVPVLSEISKIIPTELQALPQWVVWRYEENGGKKPRKVPYQPHNPQHRASSTSKEHWATFETAVEAREGFTGIGFVFTPDDPYCGIDLDNCIVNGETAPWAEALLRAFPGYAEVSPSGNGIKLIGKGTLPRAKKRKHIEMYDRARFFTVTANMLPGRETLSRWGNLDDLYHSVEWIDTAITHRANTFPALFNGEYASKYDADESEADFALMKDLLASGAPDLDAVMAVVRLSGLYDAKWEREDYQQRTYDRAYHEVHSETQPCSLERRKTGTDDMSIAIALTDQLAGHIAFDTLMRSWRNYNGSIWTPLLDSDVLGLVSRAIYSLLGECRTRQARDVLALLVPTLTRKFDATMGLPMVKEVLDLDTRERRPYAPEDGFTWHLPFDYDPEAQCPTIVDWLHDAVGAEHVELLRAFARAVVVGYCFGQVYLEAYGPGGAGKSTFANLVRAVVGNQNTVVSSFDRLKTNRFELSGFVGKRLAIFADENPYIRDVSKFKALTGLDPLPLEFKREKLGNHFVFHGLCIVTANEPLQSTDRSSGLGRRRLLVPFARSTRLWSDLLDFREDQVIGRFAEELPGFFNYLLAMPDTDMRELLKPFGKGSAGLQSTFRAGLLETNVLAQWAEDCLVYDPDSHTKIGTRVKDYSGTYQHMDKHLYPSYLAWSERQGNRETMTLQNFSRDLVDLLVNQCGYGGVEKKRTPAGNVIMGVRFRTEGEQRMITGTSI